MGVNELISDLVKTFGSGVVTPASDLPDIRRIRSTIPMYNYISGGGYPINRIIEHYGDYSSLKSYTAYDAIAKFQRYDWANGVENAFNEVKWKPVHIKGKKGEPDTVVYDVDKLVLRRGYKPLKEPRLKRAVLIDVEGTYTPDWGASTFGIDNQALIYDSPDSMAKAVDVTEAFLSHEDVSLVVFDSLSAAGADAEVDSSMSDEQMAVNARFWNKAIRKFQAAINRNPERDVTLIVINSAYEKVGFVMGDPEKVKNGVQLKLAKALSIRFRALKEQTGKDGDGAELTIGRNVSIKCMKNKTARPFLSGTFYFSMIDADGVSAGKTDVNSQIVELAIRYNLVERTGAWYTYKELKAQGMDEFRRKLVTEGLIKPLSEEVYAKIEDTHSK